VREAETDRLGDMKISEIRALLRMRIKIRRLKAFPRQTSPHPHTLIIREDDNDIRSDVRALHRVKNTSPDNN